MQPSGTNPNQFMGTMNPQQPMNRLSSNLQGNPIPQTASQNPMLSNYSSSTLPQSMGLSQSQFGANASMQQPMSIGTGGLLTNSMSQNRPTGAMSANFPSTIQQQPIQPSLMQQQQQPQSGLDMFSNSGQMNSINTRITPSSQTGMFTQQQQQQQQAMMPQMQGQPMAFGNPMMNSMNPMQQSQFPTQQPAQYLNPLGNSAAPMMTGATMQAPGYGQQNFMMQPGTMGNPMQPMMTGPYNNNAATHQNSQFNQQPSMPQNRGYYPQ
jgi:hypothetical protein